MGHCDAVHTLGSGGIESGRNEEVAVTDACDSVEYRTPSSPRYQRLYSSKLPSANDRGAIGGVPRCEGGIGSCVGKLFPKIVDQAIQASSAVGETVPVPHGQQTRRGSAAG